MFVRFPHREKLRAPASLASMPPALGRAARAIVQTQFDRTQKLVGNLAGLSSVTMMKRPGPQLRAVMELYRKRDRVIRQKEGRNDSFSCGFRRNLLRICKDRGRNFPAC